MLGVISKQHQKTMTRQELIELGGKIVSGQGTEREIVGMIELFTKNVPYPNDANLFFYPKSYNARISDLSTYSQPSKKSLTSV